MKVTKLHIALDQETQVLGKDEILGMRKEVVRHRLLLIHLHLNLILSSILHLVGGQITILLDLL